MTRVLGDLGDFGDLAYTPPTYGKSKGETPPTPPTPPRSLGMSSRCLDHMPRPSGQPKGTT